MNSSFLAFMNQVNSIYKKRKLNNYFKKKDYPFLVGRALFTASKFPKLLNTQTLET